MESLQPQAVPYTERYLTCSWTWFQDPELRALTSTPAFTRADQQAWFAGLQSRDDYRVWGIELADAPIGAFGFKHIEHPRAEYFGYIGEKACWNKGIGHWLMNTAIALARDDGIYELYLTVSSNNERAIHLYGSHGFTTVAADGPTHMMECHLR